MPEDDTLPPLDCGAFFPGTKFNGTPFILDQGDQEAAGVWLTEIVGNKPLAPELQMRINEDGRLDLWMVDAFGTTGRHFLFSFFAPE